MYEGNQHSAAQRGQHTVCWGAATTFNDERNDMTEKLACLLNKWEQTAACAENSLTKGSEAAEAAVSRRFQATVHWWSADQMEKVSLSEGLTGQEPKLCCSRYARSTFLASWYGLAILYRPGATWGGERTTMRDSLRGSQLSPGLQRKISSNLL